MKIDKALHSEVEKYRLQMCQSQDHNFFMATEKKPIFYHFQGLKFFDENLINCGKGCLFLSVDCKIVKYEQL